GVSAGGPLVEMQAAPVELVGVGAFQVADKLLGVEPGGWVAGAHDRRVVDRAREVLGQAVPPKKEAGLFVSQDTQEAVGAMFEPGVVDCLLVGLGGLALFVVAGGGDREQRG